MRVYIPRYFNIRMTEASGDFLNINAVISKQGSVGVTKIVYTDML